ncbi:hypothetical protein [Aromatoleum aromaticum]|uniref:hypothetical protein n=1 Tax=Aromatoleum aromaticum TaxID=551760 RepID=UPI0014594BAD|nr:hypothetical protein [Aromatoleum aromaticum]NMG55437.1 hypothetical protein [Aromatoleum aromaticum]
MIDPLTLFDRLRPYGTLLLTRRFAPCVLPGSALVLFEVLELPTAIPKIEHALVVKGLLIALVLTLFANAVWQWPHEKRWVQRVYGLIDQGRYDDAARELGKRRWLASFATRVQQQIAWIRLHLKMAKWEAVDAQLQVAEQDALLPVERSSCQIAKAALLYLRGEHMAFRGLFDQLDATQYKSLHDRNLYGALLMHRQNLTGKQWAAKRLLESRLAEIAQRCQSEAHEAATVFVSKARYDGGRFIHPDPAELSRTLLALLHTQHQNVIKIIQEVIQKTDGIDAASVIAIITARFRGDCHENRIDQVRDAVVRNARSIGLKYDASPNYEIVSAGYKAAVRNGARQFLERCKSEIEYATVGIQQILV